MFRLRTVSDRLGHAAPRNVVLFGHVHQTVLVVGEVDARVAIAGEHVIQSARGYLLTLDDVIGRAADVLDAERLKELRSAHEALADELASPGVRRGVLSSAVQVMQRVLEGSAMQLAAQGVLHSGEELLRLLRE